MKIVKYIYDDVEECLLGSSAIINFFKEEKVYIDHTIFITHNRRFLIVYKIND